MTFSFTARNLESYFESIEVLDEKTVRQRKQVLNQFSDFCKKKYDESSEQIIEELLKQKQSEMIINACGVLQIYINDLKKQNRVVSTQKNYISHVRNYLHYRGVKITSEDMQQVNFPKEEKEEKYPLHKDEIKQILDNCKYRKKGLYLTLVSSAMRIGECVQLRKKDFDLSAKRIMVHIPAKIAKFKKARTTFISKEAESYVKKRLNEIEDNDLVFGTSDNLHNCESNEVQQFSKLTDKIFPKLEKYNSGVRKITLHSFRAYCITKAVRTVGDSFAHVLAGQDGYLRMYKRYDKEDLLEDYLKLEPALFIMNDFGLLEPKDKRIETLENDISDIKIILDELIKRQGKQV